MAKELPNLPLHAPLDELFSTQAQRDEEKQEHIVLLDTNEIERFKNHPFQIRDDAEMEELANSIKENGILEPCLVRPIEGGKFEMISGHRRRFAAMKAGITQIPCLVRQLSDEQATIIMVDSNRHRPYLLPSEKAFAYKMRLTNQRQKVVIDLLKALEQDDLFQLGMNGEINNVRFGLYAAEELTAADGSVIPKDGLLEILNVNTDGSATFTTDLPVDAAVYVQEYATDSHYILSDTKYPVTFEYAGQDTAEVHLSVNNGEAIENKLIRGDIYGKKIDEQGNVLAGAVFGLFPADATEFTEKTALMRSTSDAAGMFSFLNVPLGNYVIVELSAPAGYLFDNTPIPVSITEDKQVVEFEVTNTWAAGKLIITKSDVSTGKLLPGVGFSIRNEQGEIIREGYTDENGVVEFDQLLKGKYTYQEFKAADGYVLDETEYPFEITDDSTVIRVSMTNKPTPVDIPQTGDSVFAWATLGIAATAFSAAWIVLARKRRAK